MLPYTVKTGFLKDGTLNTRVAPICHEPVTTLGSEILCVARLGS